MSLKGKAAKERRRERAIERIERYINNTKDDKKLMYLKELLENTKKKLTNIY
jgi:hypothetical protein